MSALALLTEVDPRDSELVDDGSPDRTTAIERHPVAPGTLQPAPLTEPMTAVPPRTTGPAAEPSRSRPPAPKRAPSKVAPVATTARRRSARGPLALALALLLVAGSASVPTGSAGRATRPRPACWA